MQDALSKEEISFKTYLAKCWNYNLIMENDEKSLSRKQVDELIHKEISSFLKLIETRIIYRGENDD